MRMLTPCGCPSFADDEDAPALRCARFARLGVAFHDLFESGLLFRRQDAGNALFEFGARWRGERSRRALASPPAPALAIMLWRISVTAASMSLT